MVLIMKLGSSRYTPNMGVIVPQIKVCRQQSVDSEYADIHSYLLYMVKKITMEVAFGLALKAAREASRHPDRYSQEKLALDAGLDRTYISLLERGLRSPSLKTVFILAKKLNVSPIKLIEDMIKKGYTL